MATASSDETALAEKVVVVQDRNDRLLSAHETTRTTCTVPRATYMTLVAGSPCVKIVTPASCSTRCTRIPAQSTMAGGVGGVACFGLLIAVHPSQGASPFLGFRQKQGAVSSVSACHEYRIVAIRRSAAPNPSAWGGVHGS